MLPPRLFVLCFGIKRQRHCNWSDTTNIHMGIIILSVMANLKGDKDTESFNRRISDGTVRKGLAVIMVSFMVLFISTLVILAAMPQADVMDVLYEATSAIATVGCYCLYTTGRTTR